MRLGPTWMLGKNIIIVGGGNLGYFLSFGDFDRGARHSPEGQLGVSGQHRAARGNVLLPQRELRRHIRNEKKFQTLFRVR